MPEPTAPVFPFVVGCGRSGTTLLRVMLDSHPDLAVPLETYFPMAPLEAWFRTPGDLDPERAAAWLESRWWVRRLALPPGRFPAEASGARSYADVLRALFRVYAGARDKPRAGNKTPKHVLFLRKLGALFPEGRFVHLVRDGRDVAMSLREVDFGPADLAGAARFWVGRVEKGRAAGDALGDRYREVRYEDLVARPERVLRDLCGFLDLPFDDAMLRYHERGAAAVEGVREPGKHRHLDRPPTTGLRDWRTQMSRSDLVLFESIAGDTLDRFGYERSDEVPSPRDRMRIGLARAASGVRSRAEDVRHRGTSRRPRRVG